MDYNASVGGEYRIGSRAMVGARVRIGGPFTPIGEPDVQTQPYAVLDLGGQLSPGAQRTDARHRSAERHQHQVSRNPVEWIHQPRRSRRASRGGELRHAVNDGVITSKESNTMKARTLKLLVATVAFAFTLAACSSDEVPAETTERRCPRSCSDASTHTELPQPYALPSGTTTRVEVHFYDADGTTSRTN